MLMSGFAFLFETNTGAAWALRFSEGLQAFLATQIGPRSIGLKGLRDV